jgi:hypothetical protein
MPNDTALNAHAFGACSAKANIPTFDRQQTRAGASTSANLSKQRAQYLAKAPVFSGNAHTLYGPLPAMVTLGDTLIDTVSWSASGGLNEAVEIQNAAGQTIWRGMAQAVDDSNFAPVRIGRVAGGGYRVPILDSGRLDITIGRPLRNAYGGRSN